jgi:hypothetical protein
MKIYFFMSLDCLTFTMYQINNDNDRQNTAYPLLST